MSRFFPLAESAENQRLAHTILYVHCVTRGASTGTIIGGGMFIAQGMVQRLRPSAPISSRPLRFLRTTGVGSAVGAVLLAGATLHRMYGREDIEWRDRSWRLLLSKAQVECDDFTYAGAVAGVGVAAWTGALKRMGWRGLTGAGGVGSVFGTAGYVAWRYGIDGGTFEK